MHDPFSGATRFASPLAGVMFGTAPDPERAALEAKLLNRLCALLNTATSAQIHRHGPSLDLNCLRPLSGRNFLHVARLIEARSPAAIENMPLLRSRRQDLIKGAEIEQIFAPVALDLMSEALQMDAASGSL